MVGTAFSCIVVFQLRGDFPRTYTNFIVPGSESATLPLMVQILDDSNMKYKVWGLPLLIQFLLPAPPSSPPSHPCHPVTLILTAARASKCWPLRARQHHKMLWLCSKLSNLDAKTRKTTHFYNFLHVLGHLRKIMVNFIAQNFKTWSFDPAWESTFRKSAPLLLQLFHLLQLFAAQN